MNTAESATQVKAETPDTAAPRAVDWENPRVAAILSAAAKCFARKGFSATTLAEIGKELGLRKSIVHYYFASKAALIHEVQSFTYHKYLDRLRQAIAGTSEDGTSSASTALSALWDAIQTDKTGIGLNIEVWSAARRDTELKRRASALQRDARKLVADGLPEILGVGAEDEAKLKGLSTLILAAINGLAVAEYLEGEEVDVNAAFQLFLGLLRSSARQG
ncbi:MAG: TetR/AcrR family transcriptional regulator [Polyangiaceae bacterium]|nr:TetR/AcrR family transcriptional regulator [Polyangiaceae bacterium]